MYFLELICKFINKKKDFTSQYSPLVEANEDDTSGQCEHVFMPIDSTGEVLACSKCGLVVNKKKLKKKNIFKI